jgi:hypothetical protein
MRANISFFRIQITGRLICQEKPGRIDQRSCNGHTLLFSTGKLTGQMMEPRLRSHALEQITSPAFQIELHPAPIGKKREHHILQGVERGHQIEQLKDKSNFSRRKSARASPFKLPVSTPSMTMRPDVGLSNVPMRLSRVDVPDPEGPTMATNSPREMERETPSSARTTVPSPYSLVRASVWTIKSSPFIVQTSPSLQIYLKIMASLFSIFNYGNSVSFSSHQRIASVLEVTPSFL